MIALAMVNSGFRHLASANDQIPPEVIENGTNDSQPLEEVTNQNSPDESESEIELTQDESFRYVKLTSDDGDISYRISNSNPQKLATVPNGIYASLDTSLGRLQVFQLTKPYHFGD